ncbi:MAG: hypothetical protein ACHQWU_09125 [Gemmatimonadales bacterium]
MMARGGNGLGQIDRWFAEHFEAAVGEPLEDAPSFAKVRTAFRRWLEQLEQIERAFDNPLAPGAGKILADSERVLGDCGYRTVGGLVWAIEPIGEAIAWGTSGANPKKLMKLRKEAAARNAWRERRSAEVRDRASVLAVMKQHLAHIGGIVAETDDGRLNFRPCEPLDAADRVALVEHLAELLGVAG